MQVTTTVQEAGQGVEHSLRQTLKLPLSVVHLDLPEADATSTEEVNATTGLKEVLKLPLVVVPESVPLSDTQEGAQKSDASVGAGSLASPEESYKLQVPCIGELEVGVVPSVQEQQDVLQVGVVPSVQGEPDETKGDVRQRQGSLSSTAAPVNIQGQVPPGDADEDAGKTNDTRVHVELPEDEPPPPPVTIFQLLCRKKYLIRTLTPFNPIPSEEDVLDRFSVIDLWARRLFPTTFFILFTIYWILFNYYITDEFPHEDKEPSDGLVVV